MWTLIAESVIGQRFYSLVIREEIASNGAPRIRLLWRRFDFLRESVALRRFAVHSDGMSNSGSATRYYWCLRHNRVETDDNVCAERYRLGPYGSEAEARRALDKVAERNAEWDAEDSRWAGEKL
jgi:hypothetical protein